VVLLPNEMLCGLFDAVWSIPKEPIIKTVLADYQNIIFTLFLLILTGYLGPFFDPNSFLFSANIGRFLDD